MLKNVVFLFLIYFSYLSPLSTSNVSYFSSLDQKLTLDQITILPASDNAKGIYAKPLEKQLKKLVQESHHWNLVEEKIAGPIFSPQELQNNEARVKNIIKTLKADAFIATGIIKNPSSLTLTLSLFLKKDSKLFLQVKEEKFNHFEISKLKEKLNQMFQNLMSQLPYKGKILSRRGKSVTVGLGTKDGIRVKQELPVIQIVKMKRHPKFHFLIKAEKQIIGKIKILKVQNTLSFATILMEVEPNTIQKNSKIAYIKTIQYNQKP